MRSAVHENLPPNVIAAFVNDCDETRSLQNSEWIRPHFDLRDARRQAISNRIVLTVSCAPLVV
jgi:hypothetical protein